MEILKGMLATSKAGHDFRKLYMIIDYDNEYVYLSDGDLRKVDNPKKKKYKHIQIIKMIPKEIGDCFDKGMKPDDANVRKAIKTFSHRFV